MTSLSYLLAPLMFMGALSLDSNSTVFPSATLVSTPEPSATTASTPETSPSSGSTVWIVIVIAFVIILLIPLAIAGWYWIQRSCGKNPRVHKTFSFTLNDYLATTRISGTVLTLDPGDATLVPDTKRTIQPLLKVMLDDVALALPGYLKIDYSKVLLRKKLRSGSFGDVFEGFYFAESGKMQVIIKCLKSNQNDLELSVLGHLLNFPHFTKVKYNCTMV